MLILRRGDVRAVLDHADATVCEIVRNTYVAHARKDTAVPHSVFLRFPGDERNRVIALPAFVGAERPVAGIKWIASFPDNVGRGQERATAAILLNSMRDGRPVALVEGAVISARRTAASAALAAAALTEGAPAEVRHGVTLVGCGVVNAQVLRFLRDRLPELRRAAVIDSDASRARAFADRAAGWWPELGIECHQDPREAMAAHRIVSIATTASAPHLSTASCRPGTVVLHLSLRDLIPESILDARNIVDDTDHVCRAATSLDLAQRLVPDRGFVHAELGDVLAGDRDARYAQDPITIFSPFGLGALDVALAAHVLDAATALGLGIDVPDFLEP